jgi:hypothetical protein
MIGVLAQTLGNVTTSYFLVLGLIYGGTAFALHVCLMFPILFDWRHARNLHTTSIALLLASSFVLFLEALATTSTISAAMYATRTVSLELVEVERGLLSEIFLWLAAMVWLFTSLFMWWVRQWEIMERRAQKRAAGQTPTPKTTALKRI